MSPPRHRLEAHVATWAPSLGRLAQFVYHHTDVRNAAAILNGGWLYSRQQVAELGLGHVDAASAQVLANTSAAHKDFVRLYFYPKTPTQWNCEGIRPSTHLTDLKAHCPVPVFFLFDFVDLLGQDGVCFSNGNMAKAGVEWDDTEDFFDAIPFKWVYHRSSLHGLDRDTVVFHRNAEVLVPKQLSTSEIKTIRCRSHAERLTLLHLLNPEVRQELEARIKVAGALFYNRKWAFVESVTVTPTKVHLAIHPPEWCNDPIPVHVKYKTTYGSWVWRFANLDTALVLSMKGLPIEGTLTVKLAENLAFRDDISLSDEPY